MSPYSILIRQDEVSARYVQVAEGRLHDLIRRLLVSVAVDENWYLKRYQDVAEAIRLGTIATAAQHYIKAGYFEGRFPRKIVVDESWYLSFYHDVAQAISDRVFASAQEHFERDGFWEGRLPSSDWEL